METKTKSEFRPRVGIQQEDASGSPSRMQQYRFSVWRKAGTVRQNRTPQMPQQADLLIPGLLQGDVSGFSALQIHKVNSASSRPITHEDDLSVIRREAGKAIVSTVAGQSSHLTIVQVS